MKNWILIGIGITLVVVILLVIFLLLPYLKIKSISHIYSKKWSELSQENKDGLLKLGWKAETWDSIDKSNTKNYPDSYYKKMSELSENEKKGATGIGHNSLSWNQQQSFGFPKKLK